MIEGIAEFKTPSEFLVAIKKLSSRQKEQMLLDLAWKCWVRPPKMSMKRVALQSYNTYAWLNLSGI